MIEATSCGGVVIFRGKILLLYKNYKNRYEGWVLPKGTVEEGEEYKDTAVREVLEETGYTVRIERFCGLTEEITTDEELRRSAPDYTHRVLHIFLVTLTSENAGAITELDQNQTGSVWVPLEEVETLPLRPFGIALHIKTMVEMDHPIYLPAFYV